MALFGRKKDNEPNKPESGGEGPPPSAKPPKPAQAILEREAATRTAAAGPSAEKAKINKVVEGEEAAAVGRYSAPAAGSGAIKESEFMDVLAQNFGMERVDLQSIKVTPDLLKLIPQRVAREFKVFPVAYDDILDAVEVAISDPTNIQIQDDLERILQKSIIPKIAREAEIERFIKRWYESDEMKDIYQKATDDLHDREAAANEIDEYGGIDQEEADDTTPPVVKFVDMIFHHAVNDRASDIHIEPTRVGVAIRFRIDGVCHEVPSPPKRWQNSIISRLKVLSGMDLAEKRIPQDGRIKLNMKNKKLDLRVSCLPSIYGESIVMRILDQSSVILGLEDVGFLPDNIRIFENLIRTPTGVILMTGPTGSGKTTTLYSALSQLNNSETKIVTVENPVEYMMDGVNQIQINEEAGLTFATGLRAILRQSPDVLLVGEIRDTETAEIAIRAALTGHLVFSTLHTNDAPSATTRLVDMGVKPFLVASSIQAVIAQRLVRRLCAHCKTPVHTDIRKIEGIGASKEDLENGIEAFEAVGCDRCSGNGYRGRTAIHEIFVMDARLRQLVIRGEPSSRLKRIAIHNGMRSLRMDGWQKVKLGQTSIEELDRVTAAD